MSTQTVVLGTKAITLRVDLERGSSYDDDIRLVSKTTRAPIDWPAGTSVQLVFGEDVDAPLVVWDAVVSGNSAKFDKTPAQVAAIPDLTTVRLRYINAPHQRILLKGKVNADD